MYKVKLKQNSVKWEIARSSRIGASEVFDIVRYYATDEELQNCGINPEDFRNESPFTTTWALYHKIINDGIYKSEPLSSELAEFGHIAESFGVETLKQGRENKLVVAPVYANDELIVSVDVEGVAEGIDVRPFDVGPGTPKIGDKFVVEQKTMMPLKFKKGVPFKYIIQAQHQVTQTKSKFFILQIMVLKEDTAFIRGKICGMSKRKRLEYFKENTTVTHLYFKNNEHLARLINTCIERFFNDVANKKAPTPYIENDKQRNIVDSIRINSFFDDKKVVEFAIDEYINAKRIEDDAIKNRKKWLQEITERAIENNCVRFKCGDNITASFSKDGKFLVKVRNK